MEAVNNSLSEVDKVNWVVRQLKCTLAEWFTIVQNKITVYKDLVDHFRARYWNKEVQQKICVQLGFGKYTPAKGSKEKYLIQLVSKAKYLEPPMSEAEIVNKLAHHFSHGIQILVITQGIKRIEELLLLLTKWENVDSCLLYTSRCV